MSGRDVEGPAGERALDEEGAALVEASVLGTGGGGPSADLSDVSFRDLVAEMIRRLGDDPEREGMRRTPERVEKAMAFLTRGYGLNARDAIGDALFEERHDNMVLVKDIEMYSMCEHHLLPFFGKVHLAYIPDGRIMGLSKAARLVDVFAQRFQVQERMTDQIAEALWDLVQPRGVAVVVEAYHLCMMMRGVQKQNSKTITSAMRGVFLEDSRTREEFLRLTTSVHSPLS
ncbi:MAG: GTP cyclohydrolase I FolE [Gemmatimonadetes bacterium]|nr:GTP cyclohydrolase I FolE [Gemmatimonadota bacterium]